MEYRWGSTRTRIWLERVHKVRVNAKTIQRIFRDIGDPVLAKTPKRKPKQLKLFEKEAPGDSIQVDVKVIKLKREKVFQYTALDDCTRFRVLRLYKRLKQHSSLRFLTELRCALPFPMKKLQCDNGSEFPLAFKLAVEAAGIKHRYIKPRRPQQNGKVERSHRIDEEEFWSRHEFDACDDAEVPLAAWEHRYNHDRFSVALGGRTPVEEAPGRTCRTGDPGDCPMSEHAPFTSRRERAQRMAKAARINGSDLDYPVHSLPKSHRKRRYW
jgi:transposase InsO family protein